MGIAAYGCAQDEADLFRELAPGFGIAARISAAAVSDTNVEFAIGSRCVSVSHKTQIAHSTLRLLGEAGVRYLSTRSAGNNHIDVEYARSVGIDVEGVAYSPHGVADYTLMLMLMGLRNARSIITRAERHDFRLADARGKELGDLTVGVIGTGRIGAAVMERLRGFGCRVLAFDRNPTTSAEYVDLDELLRESDIITLHAPLTPDTNHLLSRDRIDRLKHGAFVINTGRGALVDTDALVSALEDGRLGGAALDVVEGEDGIFYTDRRSRPIDDERFLRLQRLPNVIITPHSAYYTEHALYDTVTNTILNCLEFEGRHRG
jgi:D-specific alpha-keto acid dehydrogenase